MTTLDKSILKRLGDCYEAYECFPFQQRFNRFKEKKNYFLEGIIDVEAEFHRYVFFHYAMFHRLYPKISKEEIIEYYERRKKGD